MFKNVLFIAVIGIIVFVFFLPSFSLLQDKRQRNVEYERKIIELKKKHEQLLTEHKRLQEDPVYLEKVAREKMGLLKKGEVIYRIEPNLNAVEE